MRKFCMERSIFAVLVVALALVLGFAVISSANDGALADFNAQYPSFGGSCNICHASGSTTNPYGTALHNAGGTGGNIDSATFMAVEGDDSDGDGFTNIVEINAGTFPGDPASYPAQPQTDALDDSVITPPNTPEIINVVANDTPGTPPLKQPTLVSTDLKIGTLTQNADGTFTYTPNLDSSSPDPETFIYEVCDSAPTPSCDTATVSIIVANEVPYNIPFNVIPRKLNVKKKGVLPVVIHSSGDFDVTTIDPETLTLEGVSPLRYKMGKKKLTLKFSAQDIVVAIGPVNDRDVVVLQLTGKDVAGVAIIGEDPVIIINKGKPKK